MNEQEAINIVLNILREKLGKHRSQLHYYATSGDNQAVETTNKIIEGYELVIRYLQDFKTT